VAGKPREQWSETYRKRVERAEAKGLSRQAARGHVEKREHKIRAALKQPATSKARKLVERERERAAKVRAKAAQKRQQAKVRAKLRTKSARNQRKAPSWSGDLTKAQRAYARKFGRQAAYRANRDPDEMAEQALGYAMRVGPERFKAEVARQRKLVRDKAPVGMNTLVSYVEDDGFPDVDWYFYH
jgi:predicted Zn-dependent peptidase